MSDDTCFADRLRRGDKLIGTFITIGHPAICEIIGRLGFDFLVLDMEHGAMPTSIIELILPASQAQVPVLVRLPIAAAPWINMALDAGAMGILAPQVHDSQTAETVCTMARYPPLGKRGLGPSRATDYGLRIMEHLNEANRQLIVAIQVESAAGLRAGKQIAEVPGLDMLFIGPGDLSVSLGVPGQLGHPQVSEGSMKTHRIAKENDLAAGIYASGVKDARFWLEKGFTCIVLGSDVVFLRQGVPDLSSLH